MIQTDKQLFTLLCPWKLFPLDPLEKDDLVIFLFSASVRGDNQCWRTGKQTICRDEYFSCKCAFCGVYWWICLWSFSLAPNSRRCPVDAESAHVRPRREAPLFSAVQSRMCTMSHRTNVHPASHVGRIVLPMLCVLQNWKQFWSPHWNNAKLNTSYGPTHVTGLEQMVLFPVHRTKYHSRSMPIHTIPAQL